jgi:hypothetical protein
MKFIDLVYSRVSWGYSDYSVVLEQLSDMLFKQWVTPNVGTENKLSR